MIPASPQTPRVPLASIINIDSPVSMVSNSVPHSPFSSNYARRLSGSENEPPLQSTSVNRRMSYTNFPSRRSSQRVSVGTISTIVEDQTPAQTAFDTLMQRAIVGSTNVDRVSSANTITPYIDDNLPTPYTNASNRSRLSTTSSYPRTPMTTACNSVPVTPMSKLTVKSFSSALRTPLGQRSAADANINRLSPAAQRFIATSKTSQHHSSPQKLVNNAQRQQSASVHPFPDHSYSHSTTKKYSIHSDENTLVENMRNLSVATGGENSANMLLSPAPVVIKQRPVYHRIAPSSLNSSTGLSVSDAAMNIRKMR